MNDSAFTINIPSDPNKIDTTMMSNSIPMLDDTTRIPTSHAVYTVESALNAKIDAVPLLRYCENGTFKNGTPKTGDVIVFTDSVTTLSGSATFYPTSNKLSTGTALCSYISGDSIQPNYRDSTGVYAPGAVTVAGNLKSISQAFAKQSFAGVTILSINVLGSVSNPAIPDGVTVKATYWGISV